MSMDSFQQANSNEVLEYLEPSENEIFRARSQIQLKLMARLLHLDVNDDPDPEKFELIEKKWINGYSTEFADLLKKKPDLIFKYVHGYEDDVVEELFQILKKNHASKTEEQEINA